MIEFDRLAVDQVDHHRGRAIAHLERPLADLHMAAPRLQRFHLRRQRVAGHDHQRFRLQLVHHLVGDLDIGLRRELRPAADQHEGRQVGLGGESIRHLLVGEIRLVVGEHRAAVDFGPAALAGQPLDPLLARQRVACPGGALVDVVGCDVAELQAHRAAIGLQRLQVLGELHAHQIVVGAEIGLAQGCVVLAQIGVDGHDRDLRRLLLEQLGHQRRIRRRDRDRLDVGTVEQILDDLHLAGLVGAGSRARVEALVATGGILAVPLLAAEMDLLEERVVETLDHDGQRLVLGKGGTGEPDAGGAGK